MLITELSITLPKPEISHRATKIKLCISDYLYPVTVVVLTMTYRMKSLLIPKEMWRDDHEL